MQEQFTRTALLLGEEGIHKLNRSRVAIFGIGGVGGYTVEALARSGVGHFLDVYKRQDGRQNQLCHCPQAFHHP